MNTRAAQDHALIMRALRMDEHARAALVYAEGERYLLKYMDGDGIGVRTIIEQPEFWAWWRMQWAARDRRFVKEHDVEHWATYADKWDRALLSKIYYYTHDADTLAPTLRVAREVMRRATKAIIATR